jgi:hypothetical protein
MSEIHWGLNRLQTAQGYVKFRTMPSVTAEIIEQIPSESTVTITRGVELVTNDGYTWFQASYRGRLGWIANITNLRLYRIPYHDMANYLTTAAPFGPVYVLNSNFAGAGEKTQMQWATMPDGQRSSTFYFVKGHASPANWEQLRISEQFIYRTADISPFEQGQMYILEDDIGTGSPWIKRFTLPGETFAFKTRLGWRYKDTGAPVEQHPPWISWVQYIKLVAIHEDWISIQGIKLPFVAEFLISDFQNRPQESMWFARGLVAWQSHTERNTQGQYLHSWLQQVITTEQRLTRKAVPWWDRRQRLMPFPELEQSAPTPIPRTMVAVIVRGKNTYRGQLTEVLR